MRAALALTLLLVLPPFSWGQATRGEAARFVLLAFHLPDDQCVYCKRFHEDSSAIPALRGAWLVEYGRGEESARRNVDRFPTFILILPDRTESKVGYLGPIDFDRWLRRHLK